jgi:hypothetical protein
MNLPTNSAEEAKKLHLSLALLAVVLAAIIAPGSLVPALLLLTLVACLLNKPQARLCAITLSVPEILGDILAALKLETPELFGAAGFSQDFFSKTAVLGDKIVAKIAHVPTTAAYDSTPGVGFYSGVQEATSLIEDVPVTLNQLRHVPIRIRYLTGLATKGIDLYRAAVANIGYSLGKYVVDQVLAQAATNISNSLLATPALCNLDTFDGDIRNQCAAQKMTNHTRWAFISTPLAESLGCDYRTRSKLFYNQKNAAEGFRRWVNLAGFSWVREYPDVVNAGNQLAGIVGDHRLAAVSVRQITDMENTAKSLGIYEVIRFYPLEDPDSKLQLTGISFQEGGTGDIILSVAILFGVHVGNGGGAAGSITDNAGLKLVTM